MIRRILLPLDPSKYSKTGLHYAIELAKRFDAEINGLVVLDLPGINDSIGPYVAGGTEFAELFRQKELRQAEEHIKNLLDNFYATCQEHNVKHKEFEYQGSPSINVIRESFFFDLLVIGMRTHFHFETSNTAEESLEKLLSHTITPILAVPEQLHILKKVLILYDGTPASARALQRFSHIAERSNFQIKLLATMKKEQEAKFFLNRAKEYLNSYGISKISTEWSDRPAKNLLDEKYLNEMDLIVLGVHQHKSLKEFVLGDLAQYLIRENQKPLFIVQ